MGKEENERFEATIDVPIIAIAMVKNPAQEDALAVIEKILKNEMKAIIPVTVILGAYLVLVRYLRVESKQAAYALSQLVKSRNISWYEIVKRESLEGILEMASQKGIDGWDAYLVSVMKEHGIKTIYTIDTEDFSKLSELNPINPISEKKLQEYQQWLHEQTEPTQH